MDQTPPPNDPQGSGTGATPPAPPAGGADAPVSWAPPPPAAAPGAAYAAGPGGRPTGAAAVSIISIVEGVLLFLLGLLIILGTSYIGGLEGTTLSGVDIPAGTGSLIAGVGIVFAIIVFLVAALFIVAGYGMWRGRRWSWMLAAVLAGISLVFGLLGLTGGGASVGNILLNIVLPAIVLFCLWQPDVKRYVGRP